MIQVWRDLRRSLAQLPDQSRVSYKVLKGDEKRVKDKRTELSLDIQIKALNLKKLKKYKGINRASNELVMNLLAKRRVLIQSLLQSAERFAATSASYGSGPQTDSSWKDQGVTCNAAEQWERIGRFSAALLHGEGTLILVLVMCMWKSTKQSFLPCWSPRLCGSAAVVWITVSFFSGV